MITLTIYVPGCGWVMSVVDVFKFSRLLHSVVAERNYSTCSVEAKYKFLLSPYFIIRVFFSVVAERN